MIDIHDLINRLRIRDEVTEDECADALEKLQSQYQSAVKGRRDFRALFRECRGALQIADEAINPSDRSSISMHEWNSRLKAATKIIRSALKTEVPTV